MYIHAHTCTTHSWNNISNSGVQYTWNNCFLSYTEASRKNYFCLTNLFFCHRFFYFGDLFPILLQYSNSPLIMGDTFQDPQSPSRCLKPWIVLNVHVCVYICVCVHTHTHIYYTCIPMIKLNAFAIYLSTYHVCGHNICSLTAKLTELAQQQQLAWISFFCTISQMEDFILMYILTISTYRYFLYYIESLHLFTSRKYFMTCPWHIRNASITALMLWSHYSVK